MAIKEFKEGNVDKIIVTRPAVSVDEDLDFLRSMEDKGDTWDPPNIRCI